MTIPDTSNSNICASCGGAAVTCGRIAGASGAEVFGCSACGEYWIEPGEETAES